MNVHVMSERESFDLKNKYVKCNALVYEYRNAILVLIIRKNAIVCYCLYFLLYSLLTAIPV